MARILVCDHPLSPENSHTDHVYIEASSCQQQVSLGATGLELSHYYLFAWELKRELAAFDSLGLLE